MPEACARCDCDRAAVITFDRQSAAMCMAVAAFERDSRMDTQCCLTCKNEALVLDPVAFFFICGWWILRIQILKIYWADGI